jgi:hypothetical protein
LMELGTSNEQKCAKCLKQAIVRERRTIPSSCLVGVGSQQDRKEGTTLRSAVGQARVALFGKSWGCGDFGGVANQLIWRNKRVDDLRVADMRV